jgi:hypothetical protein
MLESQVMDMNEYRKQKDLLEYEAMMRDPETAYLVSNEEFDRQLDELGWSPGDMVTMAGMYVERGMYNLKKSIRNWFRELLASPVKQQKINVSRILSMYLSSNLRSISVSTSSCVR